MERSVARRHHLSKYLPEHCTQRYAISKNTRNQASVPRRYFTGSFTHHHRPSKVAPTPVVVNMVIITPLPAHTTPNVVQTATLLDQVALVLRTKKRLRPATPNARDTRTPVNTIKLIATCLPKCLRWSVSLLKVSTRARAPEAMSVTKEAARNPRWPAA